MSEDIRNHRHIVLTSHPDVNHKSLPIRRGVGRRIPERPTAEPLEP